MPLHAGLSDSSLVTTHIPPQSMAAGAVNGTAIDMQTWEGVAFHINIGAITGLGALDAFVRTSLVVGMTSPTNVTNAALVQVLAANNNNVAVIEVWRPTQRFIQLVATQSVNTVVAGVTAVQYRRGGILPPTQSAVQYVKVAQN